MKDLKFNLKELRDYAIKNWNWSEIHGVKHWDNVFINGLELTDEDVNINVVVAFAYLHDSARVDDGSDILHGSRAVNNVTELSKTILSNLTQQEIIELSYACRHHTTEHKTNNKTINACFDADRLDLIRCGITPDPDKMASDKGRDFATNFSEFMLKKGELII